MIPYKKLFNKVFGAGGQKGPYPNRIPSKSRNGVWFKLSKLIRARLKRLNDSDDVQSK